MRALTRQHYEDLQYAKNSGETLMLNAEASVCVFPGCCCCVCTAHGTVTRLTGAFRTLIVLVPQLMFSAFRIYIERVLYAATL